MRYDARIRHIEPLGRQLPPNRPSHEMILVPSPYSQLRHIGVKFDAPGQAFTAQRLVKRGTNTFRLRKHLALQPRKRTLRKTLDATVGDQAQLSQSNLFRAHLARFGNQRDTERNETEPNAVERRRNYSPRRSKNAPRSDKKNAG